MHLRKANVAIKATYLLNVRKRSTLPEALVDDALCVSKTAASERHRNFIIVGARRGGAGLVVITTGPAETTRATLCPHVLHCSPKSCAHENYWDTHQVVHYEVVNVANDHAQ